MGKNKFRVTFPRSKPKIYEINVDTEKEAMEVIMNSEEHDEFIAQNYDHRDMVKVELLITREISLTEEEWRNVNDEMYSQYEMARDSRRNSRDDKEKWEWVKRTKLWKRISDAFNGGNEFSR